MSSLFDLWVKSLLMTFSALIDVVNAAFILFDVSKFSVVNMGVLRERGCICEFA